MKIPSRCAKIFVGCRFGDFVLIPTRRVLGRRQEGGKHRSAAALLWCQAQCPSPSLAVVAAVVAPTVVVDVMADVAAVDVAVPFLAASVIPCSHLIGGIPPSRHLFPPSLALWLCRLLCPPPPAVAGPQYATVIVQVQDCGNPYACGANPLSRQTAASCGPGKKDKVKPTMLRQGRFCPPVLSGFRENLSEELVTQESTMDPMLLKGCQNYGAL